LFVFLKDYAEKQDNCTFNAEQYGRSNKDRATSPSTLERLTRQRNQCYE